MELIDTSVVVRGGAGTNRAVHVFAALRALTNGEVLLASRCGSAKDCADETIELRRSTDGGRTWTDPVTPFATTLDHARGSLKLCYLTEFAPDRLLAAAMWVDRQAWPGQPLFNPQTEGCLPMAILLADSTDHGHTWSDWWKVPMPAEIGPPSLTSPLLRLKDGRLALSIETNKQYEDASKWYQFVAYFHSADRGKSWTGPTVVSRDPTGRIFNWDQRAAVAPDGRLVSFTWTYDSAAKRYLNIHRRISADGGHNWTNPEDIGITDQAGRPAILPDGRVILPWVDRFGSHSIKVRAAPSIDAPLDPATEVELYRLGGEERGRRTAGSTGETLADMGLWTFGLPFAERMPNGDVAVAYYAGTADRMDIHLARLRPSV